MRCLRHSIQAIFWKVLGSGIERDYFFTVLIEEDTKKEIEENLSIYYLILRLNNALKYLADSKIKQGDCNSPYVIPGNIWALSSKGNLLFCDLGNRALWYLTVLLWRPNKYRSTLIFFSRKNLTHLLLYTSVTRFLASSFYLQDNESQLTGFV